MLGGETTVTDSDLGNWGGGGQMKIMSTSSLKEELQ